MNNQAHQDKIKEYLAEMARLSDDLTDENMMEMYQLGVKMNYVMCCYYSENLALPPINVQSSEFRANPEKYCRMGDKQIVRVLGESQDGKEPLKLSFGSINPLDSPMDAGLCEICLNEA